MCSVIEILAITLEVLEFVFAVLASMLESLASNLSGNGGVDLLCYTCDYARNECPLNSLPKKKKIFMTPAMSSTLLTISFVARFKISIIVEARK
jgi:hypothetical protein